MIVINLRHRLVYVVLTVFLFCCHTAVTGQTVQQADAAFKEFVRLNNNGGDRSQMFASLYTCYQDYVAVLKSASSGSPSYIQAKNALKTIYPYLQNGAGFYSQNGDQAHATQFAKAYVDMPLMDQFRGETLPKDNYYPTIVYFAACNTYNDGDYANAIKYLNEYLKTGETSKRKTVLGYLYQACIKANNPTLAKSILENAVTSYPSDFDVLSMAINASIDAKDYIGLASYVNKGLALRPNDPDLLNIQGKMYEDTHDFENALKVYSNMRHANSHSLSITEHVALNTYNLGVMYFNKASLENKDSEAKKLRKTAKEYFENAANIFNEILLSDPTSVKYTQALGICYSCMGDTKQLEAANFKLSALGGGKISASAAPSLIGFNDKTAVNSPTATSSSADYTAATTSPPSVVSSSDSQSSAPAPSTSTEDSVPRYSIYAKAYVEEHIKAWEAKDQFETMDEYKKRVSNETLKQKVADLQKSAEQNYISRYAAGVTYSDMQLLPYDAENQAFLIHSRYGDMVLPVPREKNEAKIFESNWNGLQFKV